MDVRDIIHNFPEGWKCSLTPRPDQVEAYNQLIQWDKAADYSQVGTGKSLVSYLYIATKLSEGKKVLVIMPPPLIPQYIKNSSCLHFSADSQSSYSLSDCFVKLHEGPKKRNKLIKACEESGNWPVVLTMSYQLYVKYAALLSKVSPYKVIVADEAHNVSNASTKNFQALFQHVYAKNLDLLLMTATPTTTELLSAYGQIRLRNPKAYSSLSQFERMHCLYAPVDIGDDRTVPKIVGYKDIDTINKKLMDKAIRRRAKDVLKLESLNLFEHYVDLSRDHYDLYRQLLTEWMLAMGDDLLIARNKQALRQMALQLITNVQHYIPGDVAEKLDDAPMDNLKAIMDSINLNETKLLIFCNFRETVKKLDRALSKYNPALIYGDSNVQDNVKKLLEDNSCRVGILNFQSGGAGFNLQSVAHHVVIYEAIGSPGMLEQAIGRVYRGGQENPVLVWIFRYGSTISNRLFNTNFGRAEDIKQSLSDGESFADFITDAATSEVETITDLKLELGL